MEIKCVYLTKMNGEYIGYRVDNGEERFLGRTPKEASLNLMLELIEISKKSDGFILDTTKSKLEVDVRLEIFRGISEIIRRGFE